MEPKYAYQISQSKDDDKVVGFYVDYKDSFNKEVPDDSCEIYYQADKGYYSTSVSYAIDQNEAAEFIDMVTDISGILNLEIQDPQFQNRRFSPEVYKEEAFEKTKKLFKQPSSQKPISELLQEVNLTLKDKFFYTLLIATIEPDSSKDKWLLIDGEKVYINKFDGGSIKEQINKDVQALTGSKEYMIIDMKEGGTKEEKGGNKLPKISINIAVPYFDPSEKQTSYSVEWKDIE